jgi:hypothetical protein
VRRSLLAAIWLTLACAPSAYAGTAGNWERFTDEDGGNSAYLGVFRTTDGVLHVVRERANPNNTGDILHRTVSPKGALGPVTPLVNWPGVSPPDITAAPGGGLISIWGGLKDNQTQSGSATSDDSGAAWTEGPQPATGGFIYGSPVSIENGADGTVFTTWYGTLGTFVHRGTDAATANFDFQAQFGGLAFSAPNLARDGADGSLWLGWPVFAAGANDGVWTQQVDQATGAPAGSPIRMPGLGTDAAGNPQTRSTLGRWAITGRPGRPGIFVVAPANNKILFWRVGDSAATTLDAATGNHRQVSIAADPDGRIIALWGTDGVPRARIFARVSDPAVSSFGPAFEVATPPGMTSLWGLVASAQSGALIDLFANVTESDNQTERWYHTQAVPPPVLAKAVNARVVSGEVFVKLPGANMFAPVTHDSQLPVGATVDATKGRVRIVTAIKGGGLQSSDFFQGVSVVTQAKSGLATMALTGGNFGVCGKARRGASAAKSVTVRKLWGAGKGKFRTKGRYAAATIRGTTWLTNDRCDGTLIRVTQGSVTVRDLVKKRSVVVTKGHSYLAGGGR